MEEPTPELIKYWDDHKFTEHDRKRDWKSIQKAKDEPSPDEEIAVTPVTIRDLLDKAGLTPERIEKLVKQPNAFIGYALDHPDQFLKTTEIQICVDGVWLKGDDATTFLESQP